MQTAYKAFSCCCKVSLLNLLNIQQALHFRHVPFPILFNHCVNPPVNQLLSLPITNNKNVRLQVVQGFLHFFTNHRFDIFNNIHAVIGGNY